jgi:RimJ/RimL family protein N-acetyltransferase
VASRAVRLVSEWALRELSVPRIELVADVANNGSIRVAEKAGYIREGVLRSRALLGGARRDVVLFSLLPDDIHRSR